MHILAIETSCDETAAAVICHSRGQLNIVSNLVSSQIDIHKQYGGVVPEVAAREHVKNIIPVIEQALCQAKVKPDKIDLLATVSGPGLITSLMVGVEAAKALSYAWQIPLLPVNHMYAHMAGNFLTALEFPALCLIVSGGHTELIYLKDYFSFEKLGATIDDAAGEAFDKVAKLLDLGYPGGPIVSKLALDGDPKAFAFPRPMLNRQNSDFSFSGLKTAVLYAVQKHTGRSRQFQADICASFQQAVIDTLVGKTVKAAKEYDVKTVMLAGGVAANQALRSTLEQRVTDLNLEFKVPEFKLCTDNAAMVGIAAYFLSQKQKIKLDNWKKISVDPNWEL